jgi:hypothetical protein
MARRKRKKQKDTAVPLPERLALSLVDTSALLGATPLAGATQTAPITQGSTSDPASNLSGAMDNLSSATQAAQQSGPGATAQNVGSDGSTSSAIAPPTEP